MFIQCLNAIKIIKNVGNRIDTNLRSIQPQSKGFLRMQNADVTKQGNEKRMTAEIVACEIDNERSNITTFFRNKITQILHPLQST